MQVTQHKPKHKASSNGIIFYPQYMPTQYTKETIDKSSLPVFNAIKKDNISYGMVCIKKENNEFKFLMIQRPYTYEFKDFMHGSYDKNKFDFTNLDLVKETFKKIFNGMTHYEKILIKGGNFAHMWYHVHKRYMPCTETPLSKTSIYYMNKKELFEKAYKCMSYKKFGELLSSSKNIDNTWTFPKGRKNKESETELDASLREFTEETSIESKQISVLMNATPYIETFTSWGEVYKNIFYLADVYEDIPLNQFSNDHEVDKIAWLSKRNIEGMIIEGKQKKTYIKLFDNLIRKYKNIKKKQQSLA